MKTAQKNYRIQNVCLSETGVMFDPESGSTYALNDSALLMLRSLQAGMSREEITRIFCTEYEIDASTVENDLQYMMTQLKDLGLVA